MVFLPFCSSQLEMGGENLKGNVLCCSFSHLLIPSVIIFSSAEAGWGWEELHFLDQDISICPITFHCQRFHVCIQTFCFLLSCSRCLRSFLKKCEGVLLVCQCCSLRLQFFFVILGLDFPKFCTVITLSPPYSFDYRIQSISLFRILKSIS